MLPPYKTDAQTAGRPIRPSALSTVSCEFPGVSVDHSTGTRKVVVSLSASPPRETDVGRIGCADPFADVVVSEPVAD